MQLAPSPRLVQSLLYVSIRRQFSFLQKIQKNSWGFIAITLEKPAVPWISPVDFINASTEVFWVVCRSNAVKIPKFLMVNS